MKYEERKQNLFELEDSHYFVHCISADFAMGKGIAVEFTRRGVKRRLQESYPDYVNMWHRRNMTGDCIYITPNVFNLITKERYFEKPDYSNIEEALLKLKKKCVVYEIEKLAMPKIGCGLDGLRWSIVSEIIQSVFKDTDIEIVVCYLED